MSTYHNYIVKGKHSDDDKHVLQKSLIGIQNVCVLNKCRWATILDYFRNLPNPNWTCLSKCDICQDIVNKEEIDASSICIPVLKFMQSRKLLRSHLLYIMCGRPSELPKLPNDILDAAVFDGLTGGNIR